MTRFPLPLCGTCAELRDCLAVGAARPAYPRCRTPLLDTSLGRLRELVEWATPAPVDRLVAVIELLLARFARDRRRYSEIFEWSLAWDGERGLHTLRFSSAFPGWASDGGSIRATLEATARAFGPEASALWERTALLLGHPDVAQPLVGLADDGPRFKLYVQLHDRPREATALASALTGLEVPNLDGRLHLVGLDQGGDAASKLYVIPARTTHTPLSDELGVTRGLVVHRARAGAWTATELDFGLADNDLTEADLLLAARAHYPEAVAHYSALARRFGVALRRVSLGLDRPRLVLYYVLTDSDAKPAAGA